MMGGLTDRQRANVCHPADPFLSADGCFSNLRTSLRAANPSSERRTSFSSVVTEMMKLINKVWRDDRGVSALEYAILAGVVVTAVIAAGTVLSGSSGLSSVFTNLMTTVNSHTTGS